MGRSRNTDLQDLIFSLTEQEKKDFLRLNAGAIPEPEYLALFRLYRDGSGPDDEIIIEKTGISISQISNQKNYLFKKILYFLEEKMMRDQPAIRIRRVINQTSVLYQKAQYKACDRWIRKGLKLARQQDLNHAVIDLLTFRIRLIPFLFKKNIAGVHREICDGIAKEISCLEFENELHRYIGIVNDYYLSHGSSHPEEARKYISAHIPFEHLESIRVSNFQTDVLFYHLCSFCAMLSDEAEKDLHYISKLVIRIEEEQEKIPLRLKRYIYALSNQAHAAHALGQTGQSLTALMKLRMIAVDYAPFLQPSLHAKLLNSKGLELNILLRQHQMQEALHEARQALELSEELESQMMQNQLLNLRVSVAWVFFVNHSIKEAGKILRAVLNDCERNTFPEITLSAKIFEIFYWLEKLEPEMALMKLRNLYSLLDSKEKNAMKFFRWLKLLLEKVSVENPKLSLNLCVNDPEIMEFLSNKLLYFPVWFEQMKVK